MYQLPHVYMSFNFLDTDKTKEKKTPEKKFNFRERTNLKVKQLILTKPIITILSSFTSIISPFIMLNKSYSFKFEFRGNIDQVCTSWALLGYNRRRIVCRSKIL